VLIAALMKRSVKSIKEHARHLNRGNRTKDTPLRCRDENALVLAATGAFKEVPGPARSGWNERSLLCLKVEHGKAHRIFDLYWHTRLWNLDCRQRRTPVGIFDVLADCWRGPDRGRDGKPRQ
jgi:hypothetical protein